MTVENRAQAAARFLFDEHRARHRFLPIPEAYTPQTMDDAYDVQEELQKMTLDTEGPLAGFKIALTTAVMQKIAGYNDPIAGPVHSRKVHPSPATLSSADYVHLGAECEIAFRMGRTLAPEGAPYDRMAVTDAVSEVITAFEVVDDRAADFSQLAAQIVSVVADNVWNAGAVLGIPLTDWRALDLATASGRLRINGVEVGSGTGADVMGHPLEALTWLANTLTSRGRSLERDMIVLTGSIVALKFLDPGDELEFEIEGLGSAQIKVT